MEAPLACLLSRGLCHSWFDSIHPRELARGKRSSDWEMAAIADHHERILDSKRSDVPASDLIADLAQKWPSVSSERTVVPFRQHRLPQHDLSSLGIRR
jgi:hypothetical protein